MKGLDLMRSLFVTFGLSGILLGSLTIIKGGFNHHGIFIYLEKSKYFVGCIFILLGIMFFWIAFRKQSGETYREQYLKCPKCQETFLLENSQSKTCAKCGEDAENLEGFFKRHSELKDT
jgi:hypothetical protein